MSHASHHPFASDNRVAPSNRELPGAPDPNFGYAGYTPGAPDQFLGAQPPNAPDWTGSYADRLPNAPPPWPGSYVPAGAPDPVVGDYRENLPNAPDLTQLFPQAAPPPTPPEAPQAAAPEAPAALPPVAPPEPPVAGPSLTEYALPQREWPLRHGQGQTRIETYWGD